MSRQDRFSWFSGQQHSRRSESSPRAAGRGFAQGRRLHVEALEDRRMLAVITVDSLLDNTFPDGGITLREAIFAANTNVAVGDAPAGDAGPDTIEFAAALSGQTITLGAELLITAALTIDATALAQNVTIDANNASRIFNITANFGDFTIAGLRLTGGRTTGSNVDSSDTTFSGGAVRSLTTGNLTIDQSTVSGNSTAGIAASGGGISSIGAVTLTSSTVSGNSTAGYGGGIFSSGSVTLTSSTISGNSAGSSGGGIRSFSSVTLTSSSVSGNSAGGSGGGIDSGETYGYYSGIFSPGFVTLTSSTVSGNSAASRGGGIFSRQSSAGIGIYLGGSVTLTNSTVSGNSAASRGGGIFAYDYARLTHSTVSGNSTAGYGGGIFSYNDVTLTSSTVTANHATHSSAIGGGIWNSDDAVTITNSIVAGNTAGGGSPDIAPGTGTFSVNFSLLGTAVTPDAGGSGNLSSDTPLLGPLADNGGPTETHALLAGSLAIDMGDPSFDVGATPNDQRGAPFLRGVGTRVDIGAYERQTVASLNLTVDTNVDENDGDYSTGDLSLREAIGLANGSVGADTITFDAALSGDTIILGGADLQITEALTIDATSLASEVTIDADNASRIFNITATNGNFMLAGLALTGGRTTGDNDSGSDTTFDGGAIRSLTSGNLTLDQSTVSGNSTTGKNADGGGIFSSGDITLTNSTVSGNSTTGNYAYGGGIFSSGDVTLTSSTVSGNSTTGNYARGGGINSSGAVTLTSSTVSGNSTTNSDADGGGIFSYGDVTLSNSTVTANYAFNLSATGGGIWNKVDSVTITNSIVAGNGAGGGSHDINPGTGVFDVDFSLLGTAVTPDAGGSDNKFSDTPLLGPLADNGGPTETHALLAGSLAIDKGDPSILFNPAEFDQRGAPFVRVFGGRIDIGAVEDQPIAASADFDNDGDVDGADFLAWQRGFGTASPTHSDGDADNDNDVDAADLGIWQTNYGGGATLLAAATNGPSPAASAALIDAAIALSIESSPVDESLVTAATNAESVPIAVVVADLPATPTSDLPTSDNIVAAGAAETDATKQAHEPWLTDALLERVFG